MSSDDISIDIPYNHPVVTFDRMWKLLQLGLQRLKQAEKARNVKVKMDTWLTCTSGTKQYSVCLAGAVMLYDMPPPGAFKHIDTSNYAEVVENRLDVLEELRCGSIDAAFEAWDVTVPGQVTRRKRFEAKLMLWKTEVLPERDCWDYHDHRQDWWEYMNMVLRLLKEEDL